jgi:hypothetical protein
VRDDNEFLEIGPKPGGRLFEDLLPRRVRHACTLKSLPDAQECPAHLGSMQVSCPLGFL